MTIYLCITKTKQKQVAKLYEDYGEAVKVARSHVGEHNSVDGCSTEVIESLRNHVFSIRRSSSFGERSAIVAPVSFVTAREL